MSESKANQYLNSTLSCNVVNTNNDEGEYTVKGVVTASNNARLVYWASNPPDYRASFSGSGLPFPNPEMAYDETPNKGSVAIVNGQFAFKVRFPNSYYTHLGTIYNEPHVFVKVCEPGNIESEVKKINLNNGVPFRMMTYPNITNKTQPRTQPGFYDDPNKRSLRNQEQILYSRAYPKKNVMPENFWGQGPYV